MFPFIFRSRRIALTQAQRLPTKWAIRCAIGIAFFVRVVLTGVVRTILIYSAVVRLQRRHVFVCIRVGIVADGWEIVLGTLSPTSHSSLSSLIQSARNGHAVHDEPIIACVADRRGVGLGTLCPMGESWLSFLTKGCKSRPRCDRRLNHHFRR